MYAESKLNRNTWRKWGLIGVPYRRHRLMYKSSGIATVWEAGLGFCQLALFDWQKLHSLELNGCIDDITVVYISMTLPLLGNLKVLRVLGISSCALSCYGAIELAKNLGLCTGLTEFVIRHCVLGSKGSQTLVQALKHCKNISTLDMSYNILGIVEQQVYSPVLVTWPN